MLGNNSSDLNNNQVQISVEEFAILQKQMNQDLQERFERNMQGFKRFNQGIYNLFKKYKPKETQIFSCLENGVPNLYYPKKNTFFYNVADPIALCKKQIDTALQQNKYATVSYNKNQLDRFGQIQFRYVHDLVDDQDKYVTKKDYTPAQIGASPFVLMVGCGLGYQVEYLYSQLEVNNLVLIEPNKDLFFAALHTVEWTPLLEFIVSNNYHISFILESNPKVVLDQLTEIYRQQSIMYAGFLWSLVHYESPEVDEIVDLIAKEHKHVLNAIGFIDDSFFALSNSISLIKNKIRFVNKKIKISKDFTNIPVCVVGNGPSLDEDLAFLRKNQDKSLIVACGSTIETLYKEGIQPDFYMCTERIKGVSENLSIIPDKEFLSNVILVTSDVVHPAVVKIFNHHFVYAKSNEASYSLLSKKLKEDYSQVASIEFINPLVGNFGLSFALDLGFKNIYLFGIDDGSVYQDNRMHATGSQYYQNVSKYVSYDTSLHLPANFGGIAKTNGLYLLSAETMSHCIQYNLPKNSKLKVFNCSNGLKIENTIPLHSKDIVWSDLQDKTKEQLLDFIKFKKTLIVKATDQQIDNLIDHDFFNQLTSKIIAECDRPKNFETRGDAVVWMESIYQLVYNLKNTEQKYIGDCLQSSLANLFVILLSTLYFTPDLHKALELFNKELRFIKYLLEDAQKLFAYVPNYYPQEHIQFMDGKQGFDHEDSKAPNAFVCFTFVTQEDIDNYPVQKFIKRYE